MKASKKIRKLTIEIIQYKLKTKATTKRIENPKHIFVLSLEPCPGGTWQLAPATASPDARRFHVPPPPAQRRGNPHPVKPAAQASTAPLWQQQSHKPWNPESPNVVFRVVLIQKKMGGGIPIMISGACSAMFRC